MRIALTADWLPVFGGAEHVIAEFLQLWPDAPLYTTVAKRGALGPLDSADIHVSTLQKWYTLLGKHEPLLPWMPRAMERMDLRGYDVILSSSHAVGKGIIPPSNATHVCYCHTPMRYAWEMEEQYLSDFGVPGFLKPTIRKRLKTVRRWDLTTAKRVDVFVANSSTTQERIKRIYNRESTVLPPPVSSHFSEAPLPEAGRGDYYFAIGRLVPYKRFDLLIDVANALQLPLKIAGTGKEREALRKKAGPTIELLGFVPDSQLSDLYRNAKALLFPQFEDAGVVPLEAQASGTPVIAYGKGGALDTVKDGETGLFFAEQSVESLKDALQRFEGMRFDPAVIREHTRQYSSERFREEILRIVTDVRTKNQDPRTKEEPNMKNTI